MASPNISVLILAFTKRFFVFPFRANENCGTAGKHQTKFIRNGTISQIKKLSFSVLPVQTMV